MKRGATYQVTHIFIWFGNINFHLAFHEEFEAQIVPGGIKIMSLEKGGGFNH